jgi:hypothetical protein
MYRPDLDPDRIPVRGTPNSSGGVDLTNAAGDPVSNADGAFDTMSSSTDPVTGVQTFNDDTPKPSPDLPDPNLLPEGPHRDWVTAQRNALIPPNILEQHRLSQEATTDTWGRPLSHYSGNSQKLTNWLNRRSNRDNKADNKAQQRSDARSQRLLKNPKNPDPYNQRQKPTAPKPAPKPAAAKKPPADTATTNTNLTPKQQVKNKRNEVKQHKAQSRADNKIDKLNEKLSAYVNTPSANAWRAYQLANLHRPRVSR